MDCQFFSSKYILNLGLLFWLIFLSLPLELALVAQWLVSQTSTATGPGTKSHLGGGVKEEFLLQKLKQQSGQLGLKDLQ